MILDHVGFAVRDFAKSRAFYATALAPLGIRIVKEGDGLAGFNRDGTRRVLDRRLRHAARAGPSGVCRRIGRR